MKHTYQLDGMTCAGCEATVKDRLTALSDVTAVHITRDEKAVEVQMKNHIATPDLQQALGGKNSQYQIRAAENATAHSQDAPEERTWFETYKPVLLIFAYLLSATVLVQASQGTFDLMQWMRHFMGGFFLVFSFFKLLNLRAFAQTYQGYDLIARRFPAWGYLYAFAELGLGFAFLTNFYPLFTNLFTLVLMSVSLVGVLRSVLDKQQLQCACLGTVFDLPMSTVTIIEDGLMVAMAGAMVLMQVV